MGDGFEVDGFLRMGGMGRMGRMGGNSFLRQRKTSAYAEATPTVDLEEFSESYYLLLITHYLLLLTSYLNLGWGEWEFTISSYFLLFT